MSTSPVTPLNPVREVRPMPNAMEIASWLLIAAVLLFVLMQQLVAALIVGLTFFVILDRVSDRFSRRLSRSAVRPLALLFVTAATAAVVTAALALIATMLRRGAGNIPDMLNQMAEILGSVRIWLGGLGQQFIPEVLTDAEDLKATIAKWLKEHAQQLRAGGIYIGVGLLHMIMGGLLAVLVFFRHLTHHDDVRRGPLAVSLLEKTERFAGAFARVAAAQIKISALNTLLTGIYLLVVLPLFGLKVPFAPTLVLLTFICGLIPVLGNLISNTFITILSMGVSVTTAVASLAFLVVIHKLEYLVNSRIVGGETDSQAWEILLVIIIGEAAFGVGGVVLAPIIYAFIKGELRERALV